MAQEPKLSIGDASVLEGGPGDRTAMQFTVTLDPAAPDEVTVNYLTTNAVVKEAAERGTDFLRVIGSLTFAPGETGKTVEVTVIGDDVVEPDELFRVVLFRPTGASIKRERATGKIRNDDIPLAITLVVEPAAIGENGGVSRVTARQDRPSSRATTVTVSVTPEAPAVEGDYTLGANPELTIPAGATESTGEVTITAVDNDAETEDKRVTVSAAAANAQGITDPQDVTLTIEDDDLPKLSIGDASAAEGGPGDSTAMRFTVTLDPAAPDEVTVSWFTTSAAVDEAADPGTDFTQARGTLAFAAGETGKTVEVTVIGDDADEPDEPFRVVLHGEGDTSIRRDRGTGTIRDDDGDPPVTLVVEPAAIGEKGGVSHVTARLDRPSSEDTTVTVSITPQAPAAAGDYTVSGNRVLTIPAGETESTDALTIAAVDNDVDAPDKEVTVSAEAVNALGVTAPQAVTLTIEGDDSPVWSVLAEGRRVGAAALLRRHAQRFSQLASDAALGRLEGSRGASAGDAKVDGGGVAASGDVVVGLSPGWDGWGSIRYSNLDGAADGAVWDVYAGADWLDAAGRTAWGVLVGYEPGRVTFEGVRLEADHVQAGLYVAHRLSAALTFDGALGWGRGEGGLSLAGSPVTASYRSRRLAVRGGLTGDFGWGGRGAQGGLRVEPQIDILYAEEDLGAFTDSEGNPAPPEELRLTRVGLGPKLTWSLADGAAHGKLRVNLDIHNLEALGNEREQLSASLELGRRWRIDDRSSLNLAAGFDGLGSGRFSSLSLGLVYDRRF